MAVMKAMKIKMTLITDIYEFVNKASDIVGEVLVQKDYYIVNGKSILGVMSLDFSGTVNVAYPENEIDFEKFLEQFKVEE